tara:strand:- start:1003 stop:1677 length:675 start_codon:yes stop_codon:yes gene_type:complete
MSSCKLLGNGFPLLVQICLGLICVSVLFCKRYNEIPKRPIKIWILDTIKQGISALVGHFISMFYSILFTNKNGDECAMYLLVFIIDNCLGILIAYYGLRYVNIYAIHNNRLDLISGNYGNPISYTIWIMQAIIWSGIVLIARILCGLTIYILQNPLVSLSSTIYLPFNNEPDLFLVLVMIICPMIINLFVMWIQDNFLKSDEPYWYDINKDDYINRDEYMNFNN